MLILGNTFVLRKKYLKQTILRPESVYSREKEIEREKEKQNK